MNKKFIGALLLGSLVMAGGTFTACSDYDDDINSLNERVDAVEKAVEDLKAQIEAGSVITSVTSTETGVTITLSNDQTYELTNGKDGAAGKPGSVVEIGENGNWFIDGVDTGNPSRGEKGEQGDQGPIGPEGPQGPAGEDGEDGTAISSIYYKPGESGYWVKVTETADGPKEEITDIKWTSDTSTVRVVYDTENGVLLISNAEGMAEGEVISIPITSDLKSLAVIPYQLDKETNYPLVFFYNIMGYTSDFEDGNASVDISVAASTNAQAHYRLNPANANTQDWTWSMIDRVVTRAEGDQNELLSVVSTEKQNDELIVTLASNKSLEDLNEGQDFNGNYFKEHAIAALQGTNKETSEVITSDYIKVSSKDLKDFSIITGYDMATEEVFELPKAGEEDTDEFKNNHNADAQLIYTESLDLEPLVQTWAKEVVSPTNIPAMVDDMVDEGVLTYEFILPATYELGANKTNQQDFVTLEGSVLKVNAEKYPNGTAAIGTTPVVWVRAIINNKTIATGVMKVAVVKEASVEKPAYVVTVDPLNMEYNDIKLNDIVNKFTWEDMRQVYDALKITREEFTEHYKSYEITDEEGNKAFGSYVGGVGLANWSDQGDLTHTNAIEMFFNPAKIASNASGSIKITYIPDNQYAYAPIVIEFPYTISHTHQYFPEFNTTFVKDGVATINGKMVNGIWEQSAVIADQFTNLDTYEPENNHNAPKLVIISKDPRVFERVRLTGNNLSDQKIELVEPIVGDDMIVPVTIMETLANGEQICGQTYIIRFINPFVMTIEDIKLEDQYPGHKDEKGINLTINTADGKSKIATIKSDGTKMVIDVVDNNVYGLKDGDIIFSDIELSESESWAELAGYNEDGSQKLSIDEISGTIKWQGDGTTLVKDLNTTYQVQVSVKDYSILIKEGNVTVTQNKVSE